MTAVKVKTTDFATMLANVSKCTFKANIGGLVSNLELKLKNNMLSARTSDSLNTFILRMPNIEGEPFNIVIPTSEIFKIVPKITTENVELSVDDSSLTLKGNGTYVFSRLIENDDPVEYEGIPLLKDPEIDIQLDKKEFLVALDNARPFVGSAFIDPSLAGYYFSDKLVTSDSVVACFYKKRLFDNDIEFYQSTLDLLSYVEGDSIRFLKKGNNIQLVGSTFMISSTIHDKQDSFPLKELNAYLGEKFDSSVTVSVNAIKNTLDRVNVFAGSALSEEGIVVAIVSFTDDGALITDTRGRVSEIIPYSGKNNFKNFSCYVSIEDFSKVVDIAESPEVSILYNENNPNAIRVDSQCTTRVLGLLDMSESSDNLEEEFEIEETIDDVNDSVVVDNLEDIEW